MMYNMYMFIISLLLSQQIITCNITSTVCKEEGISYQRKRYAIEVMILYMSPHQFSMFVKMAFVNCYRVDCNLVNCINNCNR